jgi:hypothetical protein
LFKGHTSPEYVICRKLTEKAYTYSDNVVVLEIISGKKSYDINVPSYVGHLVLIHIAFYEELVSMQMIL